MAKKDMLHERGQVRARADLMEVAEDEVLHRRRWLLAAKRQRRWKTHLVSGQEVQSAPVGKDWT